MYLSDVPTVDLDPRVQQTLNAGLPSVQYASPTPLTMTVRLPSFDKPKLSATEIAAISGAVLLFLWSSRKR